MVILCKRTESSAQLTFNNGIVHSALIYTKSRAARLVYFSIHYDRPTWVMQYYALINDSEQTFHSDSMHIKDI